MIKKRKFVLLIVLGSLFVLLAAGVIISRAVFLSGVKGQIRTSFDYSRISLSILPPVLVLEDVKTKASSPFIAAKKVEVSIGLLSLLSKDKPVTVLLDQPVVRMTEQVLKNLRKKGGQSSLPFTVAKVYVRNGEVAFRGPGVSLHGRGVNAVFAGRGRKFTLRAEVSDGLLALDSSKTPFQGNLRFALEGREDSFEVSKFIVEGPRLTLKAEGRLTNPVDPDLDLRVVFDGELAPVMDALDLPFRWSGKIRGEGTVKRSKKLLEIDTSLISGDVAMNDIPQGPVIGRLRVRGGEGVVDLADRNRSNPPRSIKIEFGRDGVKGTLAAFHLDPVMKEIGLPWPVQSAGWGEFIVKDGHLNVNAELRDETLLPLAPDRFPCRARAQVFWDGRKEVTFTAKKAVSNFATMDVDGRIIIDNSLDISVSGEISDVREGRRFVELILGTRFGLPEISGRGSAEIKIHGDFVRPSVSSKFFLYPGAVDKFSAAFVEGSVEILPERVTGVFRVDDPQVMGVVNLSTLGDKVEADIKATRARLEYILSGLEIRFPLTGEGSGQFKLKSAGETLNISGDFSAPAVSLAGLPVRDLRCRLELAGENLAFPDLRFNLNGGSVQAVGQFDFPSKKYSIDLNGKGIDLAPLQKGLRGSLSFGLKGQGVLGQDAVSGRIDVRDPGFDYIRASSLAGDMSFNVLDDRLEAKARGFVAPGRNEFSVNFFLPFQTGLYGLDLKGSFENLDIIMPWPGARGQLNYLAQVQGGEAGAQVKGVVDFQGPELPLPGFSQALNDFSGLVFIDNRKFSLRSFQAKLGGGDVRGSGEVSWDSAGLAMSIGLEGKDIVLVPLERTRALVDGSLQLVKDAGRFVLEGNFQIKKLSWQRQINEPFILSSKSYHKPQTSPGFFDDLGLNIRLKADDDAVIDNALGRIRGRFDLTVTGTAQTPIILGTIEALEGTVNFRDRKFNILRGNLNFFNPLSVDPYLDFRGETYVKDYRVTFSLSGLLDHLKLDFTSSPPLPPEDVLALLTMGESFRRLYSYDSSTLLSSASLLTFQLSEDAQKSASRLFNVDRISIDPFIMSSSMEMVPRLTLGKRISRSLVIYYSTNLTTQREEIVNIEWDLGSNFSLVGIRDELGRISLDVKVRKRF